jgi:hypothetical protein
MRLRSRIDKLERRGRRTGYGLDVLFRIPDNGRDGLLGDRDMVRFGCVEIYRYRGEDYGRPNGLPEESPSRA